MPALPDVQAICGNGDSAHWQLSFWQLSSWQSTSHHNKVYRKAKHRDRPQELAAGKTNVGSGSNRSAGLPSRAVEIGKAK